MNILVRSSRARPDDVCGIGALMGTHEELGIGAVSSVIRGLGRRPGLDCAETSARRTRFDVVPELAIRRARWCDDRRQSDHPSSRRAGIDGPRDTTSVLTYRDHKGAGTAAGRPDGRERPCSGSEYV